MARAEASGTCEPIAGQRRDRRHDRADSAVRSVISCRDVPKRVRHRRQQLAYSPYTAEHRFE
jgi:hypothetical protein